MKYYVEDPKTGDNLVIDEYVVNSVLKQYIERRYTFAFGIGMYIIGFLCGVIAYAL